MRRENHALILFMGLIYILFWFQMDVLFNAYCWKLKFLEKGIHDMIEFFAIHSNSELFFLPNWCSCWCVFVEEQEDICWCAWWSYCCLGSVWIAWVPPANTSLPCFDYCSCNLVLVVQCIILHQQVGFYFFTSLQILRTSLYTKCVDDYFHRSPPRIPDVHIPEDPFLQVAAALRIEINRGLALLREIASGRDLKMFLAVSVCSLGT